jgi:hypothetical protein
LDFKISTSKLPSLKSIHHVHSDLLSLTSPQGAIIDTGAWSNAHEASWDVASDGLQKQRRTNQYQIHNININTDWGIKYTQYSRE